MSSIANLANDTPVSRPLSRRSDKRGALVAQSYTRAAGRTCHIVDIENLVGRLNPEQIYLYSDRSKVFSDVSDSYRRKWVHGSDLVYVGCDAAIMFNTAMDWQHYSVRFGRGKDGADRALIEVIDLDAVARSCDVLQIASGDHVFAPLAMRARREGLFVRGVARAGQLSYALRENCDAIYTMV